MKRILDECGNCGRVRPVNEETLLCERCEGHDASPIQTGARDLVTLMAVQGVRVSSPTPFAWVS